jgi:hypothetical protein
MIAKLCGEWFKFTADLGSCHTVSVGKACIDRGFDGKHFVHCTNHEKGCPDNLAAYFHVQTYTGDASKAYLDIARAKASTLVLTSPIDVVTASFGAPPPEGT